MKIKRKYFIVLVLFLFVCSVLLFQLYTLPGVQSIARFSNSRSDTGEMYATVLYEKKQDATDSKNLQLYARSAALMDASSGRILYEKDGNKKLPMASTTKIMTCIIVLENSKGNEVVTVSSNAAKQPDVQLNANTGDQYYVKDLLYALMLESYNDVAVALAEHVGGSVEGFAALMNEKARQLGCKQTSFVTPNGLDASEHYTTAQDLCKIAAYAIQNSSFLEITNTMNYSFKELTTNKTFQVNNKDRFLSLYQGAFGVKTGFTGNAGYCFVGAANRDDTILISAVLGSGWPPNKNYKWSDTTSLMDYGFTNFSKQKFFENVISLPDIEIINGARSTLPLEYTGNSLEILADGTEEEEIVAICPSDLTAPVKKGTQVGELKYYINEECYATIPIYASISIPRISIDYTVQRLFSVFCM